MNSIRFPNMFEGNSTKVIEDLDASKQDLKLLLGSEKGELFGDPFFGVELKRYLFDQNDYVLRQILIDKISNQINVFAPQLLVNRSDITITKEQGKARIRIKALNRIDFTTNMYDIVLFQDDER